VPFVERISWAPTTGSTIAGRPAAWSSAKPIERTAGLLPARRARELCPARSERQAVGDLMGRGDRRKLG